MDDYMEKTKNPTKVCERIDLMIKCEGSCYDKKDKRKKYKRHKYILHLFRRKHKFKHEFKYFKKKRTTLKKR